MCFNHLEGPIYILFIKCYNVLTLLRYHRNGIIAALELRHTMLHIVGLHCRVTKVLKLQAVS